MYQVVDSTVWDGVYSGTMKAGKREGQGTMKYFDGSSFAGQWLNDEWSNGTLLDGTTGEIYCGEFQGLLKNGQGKSVNLKGDCYKGPFLNGYPQGKGHLTEVEAHTIYEGYFARGVKEGYGCQRSVQEGDEHKGKWRKNLKNGPGRLLKQGTNQTTFGIWNNGKMVKTITLKEGLIGLISELLRDEMCPEELEELLQIFRTVSPQIVFECYTTAQEIVTSRNTGFFHAFFDYSISPGLPDVKVSKVWLSLKSKDQETSLRVLKPVVDTVEIHNYSKVDVNYSFQFLPSNNFKLTFSAGRGKVPAGYFSDVRIDLIPVEKVDNDILVILLKLEAVSPKRKQVAHRLLLAGIQVEKMISNVLEIPYEKLQVGEILGMGSFGVVTKVSLDLSDQNGFTSFVDVAVKQIHCLDTNLVNEFRIEASLLALLSHPNIVRLIGLSTAFPRLCIITEFVKYGSMQDVLTQFPLSQQQVRKYLLDAASGLSYLHCANIIHRDVKSQNLLVSSLNPYDEICVKIADFGIARVMDRSPASLQAMTMNTGTLLWCAPEMISREKKGYTEKVDVYSFGIVSWEVINKFYTGAYKLPYWDRADVLLSQLVETATLPNLPVDCHSKYAALIRRCCTLNPEERLTFQQVTTFLSSFTPNFPSAPQTPGGIVQGEQTPESDLHPPSLPTPGRPYEEDTAIL